MALSPLAAADGAPDLTLANVYRGDVALGDYYVSEKLDGVRAYWDGEKLRSRQGNIFTAPEWFTRGLPTTVMDGELWSGRGRFEEISGIVRRAKPHEGWRTINYMIFDLPNAKGDFRARLQMLKRIVAAADLPHLRAVAQWETTDEKALRNKLEEVAADGGEGLMLRRKSAPYRGGRGDDLLKLKLFSDAEAEVVAHYPGKGKFSGMLGGMVVETPEGVRFKIGGGFTDEERRRPPPIGATVTYKHSGFTNNGKPRFATFLRVRSEEPPSP